MKDRRLLMIPGPVEFTPEVLQAMSLPTTSHLAANFAEVFGQALERLREVVRAPGGQPFVVAGSGTLAMEIAAANLIEPGDRALVVNTGFFSERFVSILERYGAEVTVLTPPVVGDTPPPEAVEEALKKGPFKLMTVTQVDTSTGVLTDVRTLALLGRKYETLVVVDGVCSVAGEELWMEEWDVDLTLTASQKAIGVPPGLAIVVAGARAMEAFRKRKTPVRSYYADWANWLPVMESYEARRPIYFGTPPVNLVWALNVSLGQMLAEGLENRWARHRHLSAAFKAGLTAIGLKLVPVSLQKAAHTLTTAYYPEGIDARLLGLILEAGVIVASGRHSALGDRYFRVGHMGAVTASDILATLGAIEWALARSGYPFDVGAGLAAAERVLAG
ncbi:MAG: alanine--glyoxylate aminotransferase family protein [Anaerolineae bacterium]|nr:alanine--glyoxylate aminotransferase family protein [Anaerolineae bacterium]MDW8067401.1 alanine--glyoxylate aminotransferase family protein [Anaerolineae bacterium]